VSAASDDDTRDRQSLRDLDGVRVSVDELAPALVARGVSREGLRKAVESQLRRTGITVLNAGEFPVGDPYLDVRITASKESGGLLAYAIEVSFVQIVFLRRNPAATFNRAQTWKASAAVELVHPVRLSASIEENLSGQIDQFVQAYLSANPK
jgi:hypothetical protein